MTQSKNFVFDADMARYIYSVSPDALAEMATGYAQVNDTKAMQAVIDIGVLDGADQVRKFPVPHRLVRAISPLIFLNGFESHAELFTDWLSRCAKSQPAKVASLVYDMVAQDKIKAESLPGLLSACGLTFTSPMDEKDITICANNHQEYAMSEITLGGMLLLRQTACIRTLIQDMNWPGTLNDVPILARSERTVGDDTEERVLNLLDVGLLGNGPNDPETAAETFALALSMLDMSQRHLREAVTDAVVRADKFDVLNAEGTGEPINLVTLAIDAGCDLEDRSDLISGRGFQMEEGKKRMPLLHCLVSTDVKDDDEDYLPSNAQVINAARRVIAEGGADPNEFSVHGQTALHSAILYKNARMVEMLLEHGADTRAKQKCGGIDMDAAETAQYIDATDIERMILAWNARQAVERAIGAQMKAQLGVHKGAA